MTGSDSNDKLRTFSGMPATEFVRHRDSMLLLDRLEETRDDFTICMVTVPGSGPFVVPKLGIPVYVGVEIMAQCIAVHGGARARASGFGPPLGYFLGTREFTSSVSYFDTGAHCHVRCKELFRDANGMGSYDCSIILQNNPVAEARLSVLEKELGRKIID